MVKKIDRLFVDPEFKKKMIHEAKVVRGVTVMEYTRQLAAKNNSLDESFGGFPKSSQKKKKSGFDFGF